MKYEIYIQERKKSQKFCKKAIAADIKEDTPAPAMPAGGGMGMM